MSTSRNHPPYEEITARWGGMKVRNEIGEKIEKWLSAFEEVDRSLLLELLNCFLYYSEEKIKEKVVILYQLLKEKCPEVLDVAIFTKPIKDYGTSFSSTFFVSFWLENQLKDYAEDNVIGLLAEDIIPPVLVIVDDYSGSGQTIIKTIDKLLEENPKVDKSRIIILLLALSEDAEQSISNYSIGTGLSIEIISLDKALNAFKTGYVYSKEQAQQKQIQ